MGRGRIEIKKIENSTTRQVTYSKRRLGIMKKAKEFTVLCDADVSVIMLSSTGKFADYCNPSTNIDRIMDRYQQVTGIDLWSEQFKEQKMQNTLMNLEEINRNLCKEIRQRMGEDLDELSVEELRGLEQSLDETLMNIRQRKLKSTHEAHRSLLRELEMKDDHKKYGFVTQDAAAFTNEGVHHMFAFRVQQSQPNLLRLGFGSQDRALLDIINM